MTFLFLFCFLIAAPQSLPEQAAVPLLWHSTCSIFRFWSYLTEEILEKSLNLALIVVFNFIFCIVCTLCVCYNT
jgi:hypothetical protein